MLNHPSVQAWHYNDSHKAKRDREAPVGPRQHRAVLHHQSVVEATRPTSWSGPSWESVNDPGRHSNDLSLVGFRRLMICQNPATVGWLNCNDTVMVDDNTCYHNADCLHGLAVQQPGAGGA